MSESENFFKAIEQMIEFWSDSPHKSDKEKLKSLAFSILVMLDGMSASFDGDLMSLAKEWDKEALMLHEMWGK